jgi:hypothetical protein
MLPCNNSAGDVIRIQTSPLTLSGALPGSLARGKPSDLEPSRLSGNQDGLRIHPLSHVRFGNPVSTRRVEPEGMLFSDASSAPARESSARNSPAVQFFRFRSFREGCRRFPAAMSNPRWTASCRWLSASEAVGRDCGARGRLWCERRSRLPAVEQ